MNGENKNQVDPSWSPALPACSPRATPDFRLAERVRLGTLDPSGLACLHACHARAGIDSRGGLRSNVLGGRRTGYRQGRRPLSTLEAFEAPMKFH